MPTEQQEPSVQYVIQLSSENEAQCEHCTERVGGEHFAASVNHYIAEHDYQILHVGTQTSHGPNGEPWHNTVAVLGKGPEGRELASAKFTPVSG